MELYLYNFDRNTKEEFKESIFVEEECFIDCLNYIKEIQKQNKIKSSMIIYNTDNKIIIEYGAKNKVFHIYNERGLRKHEED